MTNLPCPNPACTHQFPASDLKGATALMCPRCGTVFQFRQAAAAVKPALPAIAKPAAAVPVPAKPARPVGPGAPPVAVPVTPVARPVAPRGNAAAPAARVQAPAPVSDQDAVIAPVVRLRRRNKPSIVKRLILGGVVLAVATVAVIAFVRFREKVVPQKEISQISAADKKFVGE